jgi:Lrp/AsnC family transcriptional regulator
MEGEGIITGKGIRTGLPWAIGLRIHRKRRPFRRVLKKFAAALSAMPEVMEFYRLAGDLDYMLRVVVADMQSYPIFYKNLIGTVALKNVTSRFAVQKIKSVTALPIPALGAA